MGPWRLEGPIWTLKTIMQHFLSISRKNHPGYLLNIFPGPTTDPVNQHLQGPGCLLYSSPHYPLQPGFGVIDRKFT